MVAKVDGNTLRTQRTRARVLAESLRLFNEAGEAHVTTGMIATALGMSPGNLYYHFRNKDQIVEELFGRFEERIGIEPPAVTTGPEAIEDLWLYLHLMLEGIWEYRFIYRNLDDLAARNRRLRERFNHLVDRNEAAMVALCRGLVAARVMKASAGEISALARNVLVVATYWLNFEALRARAGSSGGGDIGAAAYQVMALVAPYLVGAARAHFDRIGRTYID